MPVGGQLHASAALLQAERAPESHLIGRCVGLRAIWTIWSRDSVFCLESKCDSSDVQSMS
jgi:hypothetical protein